MAVTTMLVFIMRGSKAEEWACHLEIWLLFPSRSSVFVGFSSFLFLSEASKALKLFRIWTGPRLRVPR